MQFRTQIPISAGQNPIDYNSEIISLGSCFAVNMAEKLDFFKFENHTNPFGIIFNPVSIERIIKRVVEQELFTEKDFFFHNERWHCFDIHSDLSNSDKEKLLENINQTAKAMLQQLTGATHIIITYGTSWIYRNIESNEIVANCHKIPQKQFSKELLSVDIIKASIQNTIRLIQAVNPDVKFIFTISPVRHIKDGFAENQLSKSHLFTALHQVLKTHNSQFITHDYFPSYEIMMDELRDYRFYGEDMLHPNQIAIDYIWQRFSENFMAENSLLTMKEIAEIQKGLNHRSFNPESEQHLKFLSKLQQRINFLEEKFPNIRF
ncbi:MAG: GSCFA domain-containing protein [Flavobacterium sp.]